MLLPKGKRRSWTTELHRAFETLRSKFTESIYLVHPDEEKRWTINTDAGGKAIGSVLTFWRRNFFQILAHAVFKM